MWAAILGLVSTIIGVVGKFMGGGPTAGDQKAMDEAVTVDAMKRMDQAAAQPQDTKGKLSNGQF